MKSLKHSFILTLLAAALQLPLSAQTNAPTAAPAEAPVLHTNTAIIPVPRTGTIGYFKIGEVAQAAQNGGIHNRGFWLLVFNMLYHSLPKLRLLRNLDY